MKNGNKERIPRIKIVTIGNEFDSVVKKYLNESVKRHSADLAQVIMNGRIANVEHEENDRPTDMLIVCCGQVSEKKKVMIDDLLNRASKNGSTSIVQGILSLAGVNTLKVKLKILLRKYFMLPH